MLRRSHKKVRRAEQHIETRERILRTTVELHAKHAALGTCYAMIADKAGVSPQTVYNHFPNLGQLIHGCTSHVFSQAPTVDAGCFECADSAADRLRLLVDAHMRTWPTWRLGRGEAEVIPEPAEILARGQFELRRLVEQAVSPDYRATPEFLDAAMVLLDYPAWKAFAHERSPSKTAELASECLIALLQTLAQDRR